MYTYRNLYLRQNLPEMRICYIVKQKGLSVSRSLFFKCVFLITKLLWEVGSLSFTPVYHKNWLLYSNCQYYM